eukprot:CFRG7716T1
MTSRRACVLVTGSSGCAEDESDRNDRTTFVHCLLTVLLRIQTVYSASNDDSNVSVFGYGLSKGQKAACMDASTQLHTHTEESNRGQLTKPDNGDCTNTLNIRTQYDTEIEHANTRTKIDSCPSLLEDLIKETRARIDTLETNVAFHSVLSVAQQLEEYVNSLEVDCTAQLWDCVWLHVGDLEAPMTSSGAQMYTSIHRLVSKNGARVVLVHINGNASTEPIVANEVITPQGYAVDADSRVWGMLLDAYVFSEYAEDAVEQCSIIRSKENLPNRVYGTQCGALEHAESYVYVEGAGDACQFSESATDGTSIESNARITTNASANLQDIHKHKEQPNYVHTHPSKPEAQGCSSHDNLMKYSSSESGVWGVHDEEKNSRLRTVHRLNKFLSEIPLCRYGVQIPAILFLPQLSNYNWAESGGVGNMNSGMSGDSRGDLTRLYNEGSRNVASDDRDIHQMNGLCNADVTLILLDSHKNEEWESEMDREKEQSHTYTHSSTSITTNPTCTNQYTTTESTHKFDYTTPVSNTHFAKSDPMEGLREGVVLDVYATLGITELQGPELFERLSSTCYEVIWPSAGISPASQWLTQWARTSKSIRDEIEGSQAPDMCFLARERITTICKSELVRSSEDDKPKNPSHIIANEHPHINHNDGLNNIRNRRSHEKANDGAHKSLSYTGTDCLIYATKDGRVLAHVLTSALVSDGHVNCCQEYLPVLSTAGTFHQHQHRERSILYAMHTHSNGCSQTHPKARHITSNRDERGLLHTAPSVSRTKNKGYATSVSSLSGISSVHRQKRTSSWASNEKLPNRIGRGERTKLAERGKNSLTMAAVAMIDKSTDPGFKRSRISAVSHTSPQFQNIKHGETLMPENEENRHRAAASALNDNLNTLNRLATEVVKRRLRKKRNVTKVTTSDPEFKAQHTTLFRKMKGILRSMFGERMDSTVLDRQTIGEIINSNVTFILSP